MGSRTTRMLLLVFAAQLLGLGTSESLAAEGKFYLVGMGPGAPDLATVRALRTLETADIVFCPSEEMAQRFAEQLRGREVRQVDSNLFRFYGSDPNKLQGEARETCRRNQRERQRVIKEIAQAVRAGKSVALMDAGDPFIYGTTWYLEELRKLQIPTEAVPGLSSFNAASAAVQMSPTYGGDTSSVILTMADWPGRKDLNEELMRHRTSMVFLSRLVPQLRRHYPGDTPIAIVMFAGDRDKQQVIQATLSTILGTLGDRQLPFEHLVLVGKFLVVGQARADGAVLSDD